MSGTVWLVQQCVKGEGRLVYGVFASEDAASAWWYKKYPREDRPLIREYAVKS